MSSVLVIDDDPTIRRMLTLGLRMAGHHVREAGDGAEGLRALEQEPADVVLCDLFMPRRDGLQTLREMRRVRPGTVAVAMSGGPAVLDTDHDYLELSRHLGARAILRKPFGLAEAVRVVRQVLDDAETAAGQVGAFAHRFSA